jgi:hypothetical protein
MAKKREVAKGKQSEKSGRKNHALTVFVSLFVLCMFSILILFFDLSFLGITGKAVYNPTISGACSDSEIAATWSSVFKVSSDGIVTVKNTTNGCSFAAMKNESGNITYFMEQINNTNGMMILAFYGNMTQINPAPNISSYNPGSSFSVLMISLLGGGGIIFHNRSTPLNFSQASGEFSGVFQATNTNPWIMNTTLFSTSTYYYFSDYELEGNINKTSSGIVLANVSGDFYFYYQVYPYTPPACTPNWVTRNTSCMSNDRIITYQIDTNNCGQNASANITNTCDYEGYKLILNSSRLSSQYGLTAYVNNTAASLSRNYSSYGLTSVSLRSSNSSVVEFNWNFNYTLDLDSVAVIRQGSSDRVGYLLVRGLAGVTKTVYVSRLTNSARICIKNSDISSVDSISSDCDGTSELELDCPDSEGSIACTANSSFFTVSGLTNSGVRETNESSVVVPICTPNWTCINWSSCISGRQNRTCTDINSCNTTAGRPILNQTCNASNTPPPTTPSCISNWSCGNFTNCAKAGNLTKQSRLCQDKAMCNITGNYNRTESRECELEETSNPLLVITIIIILLVIFVIVLIIYFLMKKPSIEDSGMQQQSPIYGAYKPPRITGFSSDSSA